MAEPPSHLLEPVLDDPRASEPLYSTTANFWVAFLGGPFAFLGFSWLNTRRLGRQSQDLWLYGLCAVLSVAVLAVVVHLSIQSQPGLSIQELLRSRPPELRFGPRLMGLVLYAAFFFLYRRFHKAAEMYDQEGPSPWGPAIVALALGGIAQVAIGGLLLSVLR